MEEIKFTKWTPIRWYLIVLLLLSVFWFGVGSAKADVGYANLSGYSHVYYSTSTVNGLQENIDLTKFQFDAATYRYLYQWNYTGLVAPNNEITSAVTGNITSFSIASGGSGNGYAFYTYNSGIFSMTWVCNGSCIITANTFTISYESGFTSDFLYPNQRNSQPVFPGAGAPLMIGSSGYYHIGSFYADVATFSENRYNITYPQSGIFSINVTKRYSSSLMRLHDASTVPKFYRNDSAANVVNFTHGNFTQQGIYLNVTNSAGNYVDYLINSTGIIVTPTPTPGVGGLYNPPLSIPSEGGSIQFNQTKYVVGDTVRVEWAISNSSWNGIGQTFHIDLYSDNDLMLSDFPVPTQTGNYSLYAQKPASLTAKLYGGFLFSTNLLSTANSMIVAVQPAFLSVQDSTVSGQNVVINYGFGNSYGTVSAGYILDYTLDEFGVPDPTTTRYINLSCNPCTTGTISSIFNSVGTHKIALFDQTHIKTVATANIRVIAQDSVLPFTSIVNNSLTIDGTQYNTNDIILGNFAISGTNYSNYSYFKIILVSASGIASNFISVSSQYGSFELPVNSGAFLTTQSGSAFVNLTAQASVFSGTPVVLASVPVTILANANGYSISANPQQICGNQNIFIKYTGLTGSGTLKLSYLTPALTTKNINYNFTQNGTKTYNFADGTIADKSAIQLDVYDLNGNYQTGVIVTYRKTGCTQNTSLVTGPPAPTSTTPAGSSGVSNMGSNLQYLITTMFFWGLVIFAGIVMFVALKAPESVGIVAFVVANIEAVAGLFSPYSTYIFIVLWLAAGIYFTVGRKTTSEG